MTLARDFADQVWTSTYQFASERIRVLLPLPLGPSRPISSPGTARNEIDFKISLPPRTTRRLATSSVDWLESSTVLDTTVGERLERGVAWSRGASQTVTV